MEQLTESESTRDEIKEKLRQHFDGKIVRKDLTKKIKEGANVPVYVLEFLLGQYCSSDDEEVIESGVQTVKRILADNFVRPDEAQKILSKLRQKGLPSIWTSRGIASSLPSRIWGCLMYPSKMSIRKNTTAYCAVVSGALCSWIMNMWRKKSRTAIQFRSAS